MWTLVIVCAVLFVACLVTDLVLRRVKFRRADAKTEKVVKKYRYNGL